MIRSIVEAGVLLLLAAVLVKPIFRWEYSDKWFSVEGAYISDARYLIDHWPGTDWQPLWHAGMPYERGYPPFPRYATALIAKTLGWSPVRAFHAYEGLMYATGIAGVYLFALLMGVPRLWSAIAAAGAALVSPTFLVLTEIRNDAWLWVPQRLGAMLRYGEGTHIAGLGLLIPALGLGYHAIARRHRAAFGAAAVVAALAILNSTHAAMALMALFAVLTWSVYASTLDAGVWRRSALLAALTYSLVAFWAAPHYPSFVPEQGNMWSVWIGVAAVGGFVLVSWKYAARASAYTWFVAGGLGIFALVVLGHFYANLSVVRTPVKFIPELDLLLILAAVEGLRRVPMRLGLVVALLALATSNWYVRRAWHVYPIDPAYQQRAEYRIQDWIAKNMPQARTMVAGPVQYWFNAWHDLPQLAGAEDPRDANEAVAYGYWQLANGSDAADARKWLDALAVDLVVVSEGIAHPDRFAALPVVFDDGHGNRIHRVDRTGPQDEVQWHSPDRMTVRTSDRTIAVSYADGWQSSAGVRAGPLGFIEVDTVGGPVELRFEDRISLRDLLSIAGCLAVIFLWLKR